jgi:Sulfotransferase domain
MTRAGKGQTGRLPDFIAIGPPRTGTTWLHGVLYRRACLPEGIKETRFFDMFYSCGLDWYLKYFRARSSEQFAGELSPTYFYSREARERIARQIPSCKIICTLREPVARAYSHYRKLRAVGQIGGSILEEITNCPDLREASRYTFHLRAWQELFPESVGTFFYDDLEANPQEFVDTICRFIGVEPLELTPEVLRFLDRNKVARAPRNPVLARFALRVRYRLQAHHALWASNALRRAGVWRFCYERGETFGPLEPAVEARLKDHFLPEVEALEKFTHRDLSAWKRPAPERAERLAARL